MAVGDYPVNGVSGMWSTTVGSAVGSYTFTPLTTDRIAITDENWQISQSYSPLIASTPEVEKRLDKLVAGIGEMATMLVRAMDALDDLSKKVEKLSRIMSQPEPVGEDDEDFRRVS